MEQENLHKAISAAVKQAETSRRSFIVSEISRIDPVSPLDFYTAAEKIKKGQRFYWQNPSGDCILAGVGFAAVLKEKTDDPFSGVRDWAHRFLDSVYITGAREIEGAGPLLFGGFAFDPDKRRTDIWSEFGSGYFFLPELLLTVHDGRCYLTRSAVCAPGTDAEDIQALMNAQRDRLLHHLGEKARQPVVNPVIQRSGQNRQLWNDLLKKAIDAIKNTELNKIVLARTQKLTFTDEWATDTLVDALISQQQGTYIFCLENGTSAFLGASPERLVKKKGRQIYSACLAGSAARGNTDAEDSKYGEWLLHDDKNRQEHDYVVQTIRHALSPFCDQLRIPDMPVLMKNKAIQHLFTPVEGVCRETVSLFDLVEGLHPTAALGGLPRRKAVSWIRDHEAVDRGFYGAPIGWCDAQGNGEFNVGIRSAWMRGKQAVLYAGCGVLKDSVPEHEYEETSLKFRPMMQAFSGRVQ